MSEIRFYNTLSHREETFAPINPPQVLMYNCGPTVYDFAHIGNFRTFLFADVLRRFLEVSGYNVKQVMNLTDVGHMTDDQLADGGGDDKMDIAAQRILEAKKQGDAHFDAIDDPTDPYQIAGFYIDAFLADARKLRLKVAGEYPQHMPRATEHVTGSMVPMIEALIASEHAYVSGDGAVYFSVESFPEYGKLSGNSLEHLRGGAGGRISAENQAQKRHPADFLLWKPDESHIMKWDSPWGVGYPGWHIECSAMARAVLGADQIDIHTGGEDNIFPHHECEIAQSCGASGDPSFARYWMHSRYLLVEGAKMSKSKGNFFTVGQVMAGDVTGRPVDPAVVRLELIKAHYRKNADFTRKGLADSAGAVQKLRDAHGRWQDEAGDADAVSADAVRDHPAVQGFVGTLSDDLNVAGALAHVFEFLADPKCEAAEALAVLGVFDAVLAVVEPETADSASIGEEMDAAAMCRALDEARGAKDYATADDIRQQLVDAGYDVKTTREGTVATRKLA